MSDAITADDLDKLRHALGIEAHYPRRDWGYRNYFVTDLPNPNFARLVAVGFAEVAGTINDGRDTVFRATLEGKRAVGMTASEIERMDPARRMAPPRRRAARP